MHGKISRRKLAQYVVEQTERKVPLADVLKELAAYLIDTNRIREVELMIRAIEDAYAERGIVLAHVTTATELTAALRSDIERMIGARQVTIESIVDPRVIGGVRIETPGVVLDATLQRKLLALGQAKV